MKFNYLYLCTSSQRFSPYLFFSNSVVSYLLGCLLPSLFYSSQANNCHCLEFHIYLKHLSEIFFPMYKLNTNYIIYHSSHWENLFSLLSLNREYYWACNPLEDKRNPYHEHITPTNWWPGLSFPPSVSCTTPNYTKYVCTIKKCDSYHRGSDPVVWSPQSAMIFCSWDCLGPKSLSLCNRVGCYDILLSLGLNGSNETQFIKDRLVK